MQRLGQANGLPTSDNNVGEALGYPVGVTTYLGFFTNAEMSQIEEGADSTDADARNGLYDHMPNTYQSTHKGDRCVHFSATERSEWRVPC